jgi:hypothetical protein
VALASVVLAACGRAPDRRIEARVDPAPDEGQSTIDAPAPAPADTGARIGHGGGGGVWRPSNQHVGGTPGAPTLDFCGMKVPTDTRILWCNHTRGLDLGRLAALHDLTMLGLWGDVDAAVFPTIDCSALGAATSLRELEIGGLDCTGLDALASLPGLAELRLTTSRVADVLWIGRMPALEHLVLGCDALADLGALAGLPRLERLILQRSQVQDLGPLAGLTRLRELELANAPLADLSPLRGRGPTFLLLNRTLVEDLGPLAGSPRLEVLSLDDTRVASLEPLRRLPRLRNLSIARTRVRDLSPLADVPSLKRVIADCLDLDPAPLAELRAKRPDLEIVIEPRRCPAG